jgi:hypothetical protein
VLCSECPSYLAAAKGAAHQQRTADAWRRIYGLSEKAENISCGGCLGPDGDLFHTSGSYLARRCSRSYGFNSCAQCPKESCQDLEKAQSQWDEVPQIGSTLSPADFEAYARPYCGHRSRLSAARNKQRASGKKQ